MLIRLFLLGVALMGGVLALLALAHLGGLAGTGLPLLLEFLFFLGLLPTLMGLFVSIAPEDAAARRIAERELRQAYPRRR